MLWMSFSVELNVLMTKLNHVTDISASTRLIEHISSSLQRLSQSGNAKVEIESYVQGHLVWLKWIEAVTGFVNKFMHN